MSFIPSIIPFAGALIFITIAVTHLVKSKRELEEVLFSISILLLAGIQISIGLLLISRNIESVFIQFKLIATLVIILPGFAVPALLAIKNKRRNESNKQYLSITTLLSIITFVVALLIPSKSYLEAIHFTESGSFWGVTLSNGGKALAGYAIVVTIFSLFLFENTYRSLTIPGKVILKYPLLGIASTSIINIIIISRAIALSVITANSMVAGSTGLVLLGTSLLFATARYGIFETNLSVGRDITTSVITIIISALYLLALGIIAFIARALQLPFDRLTGTVLSLFAVFLLLAVLISGKARRRFRRFINENFYPTSYNYRKEWRKYSELMASSTTITDLIDNVISALCDSMLVKQGVIWVDVAGGKSSSYGFPSVKLTRDEIDLILSLYDGETIKMAKKSKLKARENERKDNTASDVTETSERASIGTDWIKVIAFIGRGDQIMGFIALGEKHLNSRYSEEDSDFLATIADETQIALENIMIEERIIEAKQLESFNRFTSFVIHDLKNTVGMLSLVLDNAKENINDPEFQQDATNAIKRSIDKIQRLISSLRARTSPTKLERETIKLDELLHRCVENVKELATSMKVELKLNIHEDVTIKGDASALGKVFENIIINAIEASSRSGKVGIELKRKNGTAIVAISDAGKGFEKEYLERYLFKPFHSTKKDGLGIALFICKSIIENHNGSIKIYSTEGKGSIVTIELPIE